MLPDPYYTDIGMTSMPKQGKNPLLLLLYRTGRFSPSVSGRLSRKRRTGFRLCLTASVAAIVAASVAAVSLVAGCSLARIPDGGIRPVSGSFVSSLRGTNGLELEVLKVGGTISGFWFWPSEKSYGRIDGTMKGLLGAELRLARRSDEGWNLSCARFSGNGFTGTLANPGGQAAVVPAKVSFKPMEDARSANAAFVVKAFAADGGEFALSGLDARDDRARAALDEGLRRGLPPARYAAAVKAAHCDIPEGGPASTSVQARATGQARGNSLLERQYVVGRAGRYAGIATERYFFSGGAHGETALTFVTMDMGKGGILGLADIFPRGIESPDFMEALATEARRQLGLAVASPFTEAGLFDAELPPPQDFFICSMGVGAQYDRYELAPYYFGDFLFIVPWNAVGGLADSGIASAFASAPGLEIPLTTR